MTLEVYRLFGEPATFLVKSETSYNLLYSVIVYTPYVFECGCKGYFFKSVGKYYPCKHIQAIDDELEAYAEMGAYFPQSVPKEVMEMEKMLWDLRRNLYAYVEEHVSKNIENVHSFSFRDVYPTVYIGGASLMLSEVMFDEKGASLRVFSPSRRTFFGEGRIKTSRLLDVIFQLPSTDEFKRMINFLLEKGPNEEIFQPTRKFLLGQRVKDKSSGINPELFGYRKLLSELCAEMKALEKLDVKTFTILRHLSGKRKSIKI